MNIFRKIIFWYQNRPFKILERQVREIRMEIINQGLNDFAKTHPDVFDLANPMVDLLTKHPNLSLAQAYWAVKSPSEMFPRKTSKRKHR